MLSLAGITSPASFPQSLPERTYQVLKCNFHTHTTYSNDGIYTPTQTVNLFYDAGFDVLAITDHNTNAGVSEARAASADKGMIIIPGEEVSCYWSDWTNKHVVALFTEKKIGQWQNISVETIFNDVHSQNGIGIIAHYWVTPEKWNPYLNATYIDGWEVNNPKESNIDTNWVYTSKYIYLRNQDFHSDLNSITQYCNYVLVENRTVEGVKDALLNKRVVVYENGELYGSPYALSLNLKNQGSISTTKNLPPPSAPIATPAPTSIPILLGSFYFDKTSKNQNSPIVSVS